MLSPHLLDLLRTWWKAAMQRMPMNDRHVCLVYEHSGKDCLLVWNTVLKTRFENSRLDLAQATGG